MHLGYSSMTAGIYDLDNAFRVADDFGLEFVELSHDVVSFLPDAQPEARVRDLVRATGIYTTLHLPFIDLNIASLSEPVRRLAVVQTRQGLDYAEAVGARCAVLHTGTVFVYQPRPWEDATGALQASLADLSGGSVPLMLENLGLYVDGLVRTPAMLNTITKQAGAGNCLDFGHALIERSRPWWQAAPEADPVETYIEVLKDDIAHLHLCNNDGASDLHAATPDGALEFARYAPFLSTFGGTVCLEVSGGVDSVRRSAKHLRSLLEPPARQQSRGSAPPSLL